MKTKSLIETNPYLKDATRRKELVARSVRTSCGVEGITPKATDTRSFLITHRCSKKIYKSAKKTPQAIV